MGMTIAQAITHIREDMLDDASSIRWSSTQLRRHIRSALSKSLTGYIANGGHRFSRTLKDQSVPVAGLDVVAALGDTPQQITHVLWSDANWRTPIEFIPLGQAYLFATEVYAVDITVAPLLEHDVGAADSAPLVAAVTGAPGTWDAFEELVCSIAAHEAARKDKDRFRDLAYLVDDAKEAVYGMLPESPTVALSDLASNSKFLRWTYENELLRLVRYS